VLLALLAIGAPAVAQVTETGTIEVLVQDASGLAIPVRQSPPPRLTP